MADDELGRARDRKMISAAYRLGFEHGQQSIAEFANLLAKSQEPVTEQGLQLIKGESGMQP